MSCSSVKCTMGGCWLSSMMLGSQVACGKVRRRAKRAAQQASALCIVEKLLTRLSGCSTRMWKSVGLLLGTLLNRLDAAAAQGLFQKDKGAAKGLAFFLAG